MITVFKCTIMLFRLPFLNDDDDLSTWINIEKYHNVRTGGPVVGKSGAKWAPSI